MYRQQIFSFVQLHYRLLLLALQSYFKALSFQYPNHVLHANTLIPTPRYHLEFLAGKFNISLIDRLSANGLQAFAGERYTRKITIGDCRPSPPPTPAMQVIVIYNLYTYNYYNYSN